MSAIVEPRMTQDAGTQDKAAREARLEPWLKGQSLDELHTRFDQEGYLIFKNVMSPAEVHRVRDALVPHLTRTGRNNFEGFKSNRVYSLLAKAPEVFSDMATHPLALAFVERDLGRSCLLSALLAINLLPGETVQDWHCDDGFISVPFPRPSFGVSAFWVIDDVTDTNGATEIIPRSHLWTEADRPGFESKEALYDPRARGVNEDNNPHKDRIKAIMPSGSLMLTKGSLFHRGGANRSDAPRLIVTPQYAMGWVRQLENMYLAVPKEIAANLPRRVRELIGYQIHGSFMGYVDGVHPERTLGIHPDDS